MSVGFFIWLVVTILIAGFSWWSVRVQILQKKAWAAFAKKYDLDFQENRFFESPRLEGYFGERYIRAFEGDELDGLGRKKRALIVEMDLRHAMPFTVMITKRVEQVLFQEADLPLKISVENASGNWSKTNLVGTDNEDLCRAWLIPERMEALQTFLSTPNTRAVYIGQEERAFLLMQMENPMIDPRFMNKLFKRLEAVADTLEVPALLSPKDVSSSEDLTKAQESKTKTVDADTTPTEAEAK